MPSHIAYCTNVHAGATLDETRRNLRRYAEKVRQLFRPDATMGVGLWLSARSADELIQDRKEAQFADWLRELGLAPITFNGFPYGDFHQPVVKHKVYHPTWFEPSRLDFTRDLARLLDRLSPEHLPGSISTLPLAWREPAPRRDQWAAAAKFLAEMAEHLARLETETGRLICLCIEPEPGCLIQYSQDLIDFFQTHLFPGRDEDLLRKYIRACHDVCHAVVMCESQVDVLARYRAAGVEIGKVQISSAIVADFDHVDPADRPKAYAQLCGFAEDRYLHQTTIQHGDAPAQFFDDLPDALRSVDDPRQASGTWRVHYHVPVYLGEFGMLNTSQREIIQCVEHCREYSRVEHFEVETYAWNVLPPELRQDDLAAGIAQEMNWFAQLAQRHLCTEST